MIKLGNGLYTFGRNNHGQLGIKSNQSQMNPVQVTDLKGKQIQQIAGGFYHSLVLVQEGEAKSLSNDVAVLLNNPMYSDVTFLVEGKPVYAHRCILSARCELLEKMLDGPMIESTNATIPLPNISYPTFLMLLEYLYAETAKVFKETPINKKYMLELLRVADQYLVSDLKLQCEIALGGCIETDNVCEMLELADTHHTLVLRKQCIEYIINNFAAVIVREEFLFLPKILLKEVFEEIAHRGVYVGQKRCIGNNCTDSIIIAQK